MNVDRPTEYQNIALKEYEESVVDDKYLTISEMRKAMGELFTLRIFY